MELLALGAAIAVGAVVGISIERFRSALRRRRWESYKRSRQNDQEPWVSNVREFRKPSPADRAPKDAADQLRVVMSANFSAQRLLNKSEARVFQQLETIVTSCNPRWLVMAQVSLGEILTSQSSQAYGCINSKRVDLLLVDEECNPRHVLEYQGAGHHQSTAAAPDAVKKEALRRAGIGYHEVIGGQTTPAELKRLVAKLVEGQPSTALLNPAFGKLSRSQRFNQ